MNRAERLNAVLDLLAEAGQIDVDDLVAKLDVSAATARRDLDALASQQLLTRTRGGAIGQSVAYDLPIRYKREQHAPEKLRIAQAASALVTRGAVVGLCGGTTSTAVATVLGSRPDLMEPSPHPSLTVVTNAINIANELVGHAGLRLVVIGGIVRQSYELVGPAAEAMLANYHLDIAFIGVDGLTPEEGCTTYDEMEAQTDLAFLRRSARNVVIADSSKIGRVTFARISLLSGVTDVVTDKGADPEQLEALRDAGPQVVTV